MKISKNRLKIKALKWKILVFLSRLKVRASIAHKSFIQLLLLQRPNSVQNNKRTTSLKNQFDELNQGLQP